MIIPGNRFFVDGGDLSIRFNFPKPRPRRVLFRRLTDVQQLQTNEEPGMLADRNVSSHLADSKTSSGRNSHQLLHPRRAFLQITIIKRRWWLIVATGLSAVQPAVQAAGQAALAVKIITI